MVASSDTRMQRLNKMAWNLFLEREVNHFGSRNTCIDFHYGRDHLFLHNGSVNMIASASWKRLLLFLWLVFSHDCVCVWNQVRKMTILIQELVMVDVKNFSKR